MDRSAYLIAALLALGGCGAQSDPDAHTEAVAADAAVDATAPKFEEMQSRIDELSDDVRQLKADQAQAAQLSAALADHDKWQDDSVEVLFDNDKKFAARAGLPFGDANGK